MKKKLLYIFSLFIFSLNAQDYSWLGKKLDYSDTLRLCDIYKNMKEAMVAPEKVECLQLVVEKSGNNYKQFCDNLSKFINLRKLVIINSPGLNLDIPAELWNRSKMEYLMLDGFWDESVTGIEKMSNLKFLSLDGFALKKFPTEVLALKKLAVLDLSMNLISELPQEISQMTALRELELTNNCFTEIPEQIGNLSSLEYFIMNNADFGGPIPPGVNNVCLNSFSKFPEVFSKTTKLKHASIFFHEHVDPALKKKIKSTYKKIKFS
jgi:Leucine rich repeat